MKTFTDKQGTLTKISVVGSYYNDTTTHSEVIRFLFTFLLTYEDILVTESGTKTSISKVFRERVKKTKDKGGMIFFVVGVWTPRQVFKRTIRLSSQIYGSY